MKMAFPEIVFRSTAALPVMLPTRSTATPLPPLNAMTFDARVGCPALNRPIWLFAELIMATLWPALPRPGAVRERAALVPMALSRIRLAPVRVPKKSVIVIPLPTLALTTLPSTVAPEAAR